MATDKWWEERFEEFGIDHVLMAEFLSFYNNMVDLNLCRIKDCGKKKGLRTMPSGNVLCNYHYQNLRQQNRV